MYKNEVEIYINTIPADSCRDFSFEITTNDIKKWGKPIDFKGDAPSPSESDTLNQSENENKKILAGKVTCKNYNGSMIKTTSIILENQLEILKENNYTILL